MPRMPLKHVEGVTAVVNHIEVLPLSPADDQVRRLRLTEPFMATRT